MFLTSKLGDWMKKSKLVLSVENICTETALQVIDLNHLSVLYIYI